MKKRTLKATIALGLVSAVGIALTGCATEAPAVDLDADVTITVTGKPSDDQPEQLAVFNDRINAFMDEHPNITVVGSDKNWDPQTFNAMLAGGTLPDLYAVYFTDSLSIIRNGQAADITTALEETDILGQLNPDVLELVQGEDGGYYGIPFSAYGLGLVYNRELFEQAGLDPDNPPTTWDEVRAAAKTITEETGVPGYATMGEAGQGGWMLTAASYSFGGEMENADGTEATFDSPEVEQYLQLLQDMRFEDGSVSENVLYTQTSIGEALAGGRVGMYIGSPTSYSDAVITYGMDPASFGMGAMPQEGGPHGTLTGGGVFMLSPDTTEEQKAAIALYVKEVYLNAELVEETAVGAAKANFDQGLAVGIPGLSVVSASSKEQVREWIADYINVPVENFASYEQSLEELELLIEPPVKGQDLYAQLGPVLQTVLTDPNADIESLLAEAATAFEAKLGR